MPGVVDSAPGDDYENNDIFNSIDAVNRMW